MDSECYCQWNKRGVKYQKSSIDYSSACPAARARIASVYAKERKNSPFDGENGRVRETILNVLVQQKGGCQHEERIGWHQTVQTLPDRDSGGCKGLPELPQKAGNGMPAEDSD